MPGRSEKADEILGKSRKTLTMRRVGMILIVLTKILEKLNFYSVETAVELVMLSSRVGRGNPGFIAANKADLSGDG